MSIGIFITPISKPTDISGKVDKITGKGLSTNDYTTAEQTKLSGIEAEANKYTHPTNHDATVITEDATHRFATDTEKTTWNAKQSALTINPDTIAADTKEPTGFMLGINWGLASVAIVETTKLELTIPVVSGTISTYWRGVKRTFTGPIIVTSTEDKSEGIWYCYTTDGTNYVLTKSAFYINTVITGDLRNDMMLWEFYWDNTNDVALWLQPEFHGIIMSGREHYHNHESFGTRYVAGFTATYGTLPATSDIAKRIKLSSGEVHDEDIACYINHNSTPTLIWEQSLGSVGTADANYAQFPIYYRSGADTSKIWRKQAASSYPFYPITNNVAFNYNRLNTGTWDYATPSNNNNYWNAFVVATTNQSEPIVVIAGRIISSTLSTVQAEALPNLFVEGLFTEYKYLYKLTYRNATNTAGKATLISVTDLRLDSVSNNASQSVSLSASQVPTTPTVTLVATNVQDALDELDTDKAPIASPTFTGDVTVPSIILPSNGQVKLTVPTSDGHATGNITNEFNCGYTSSVIGDLVYLDASSTWQKCDKATSAATYSGLLGIALEVKDSGNALKVALPGSFVYATGFPPLTIGAPVYMGSVGAIVVDQPATLNHVIRVIGYAIHADKIFFNPSNEYITYQ